MFRRFSTYSARLAGHSKWQNIKHRKARQDATRSRENTKITNMISVAVKEGGGPDPAMNFRLATVIENATKMSVPKKVIEGAIARVSGTSQSGENDQAISYEGVGPGGAAFIVETLTENKNRTAQQVRAVFLKYKGSLSPTAFLFKRRGWIEINTEMAFDTVFDTCSEVDGVEDIKEMEGGVLLYTDPAMLSAAAKKLNTRFKISDLGMAYVADDFQMVPVDDDEVVSRIRKLEAELEDLDDVINVYNNANVILCT